MVFDFQAPKDLVYGVHSDFTEMLGHLVGHAMEGSPGRILLKSAGAVNRFQLELEDDGDPIEARLLERALEPHPDLLPAITGPGRRSGLGLPACAQLATAYNGDLQVVPMERGSLVRIEFPLD